MSQQILATKRKTELSVLNVVLCLLVIFIHVSAEPVTKFAPNSIQHILVFVPWRLGSFVVQGFIFLSGIKFCLNTPEKFSYKRFYLKRIIAVVVPYIIFNVIYYLYFVSREYFPFVLGDLAKYIFTGTLVAPFYFVVVIIQFYALAPLWRWMVKKVNATAALVFSAVLTMFILIYFAGIITPIFPNSAGAYAASFFGTYLFYWILGCYAGYNYEKFKAAVLKNRLHITIIFCIAAAVNAILSYLSHTGMFQGYYLESIHYVFRISAVVFVYTTILSIHQSRELKNRLITGIDNSSYYIYLVHSLLIFILDDNMNQWGLEPVGLRYLIRIVVVYTLSILIAMLIRLVTKKSKQLLLGRRRA